MSGWNPSYEGSQQRDTPLPTVAARAARQAIAAARPSSFTVVWQTAARAALTATIMAGLAALFTALIAQSLH